MQPPTPARPKHFGAPQEPGAGGAGVGAGGGAAPPSAGAGVGSGVLGGVVAGAVSPVLVVPFEDAGSRVGAWVCERRSVLSSVPPEQPTSPSVVKAAIAPRETSLLNETLMYTSRESKRRTRIADVARNSRAHVFRSGVARPRRTYIARA